MREHLLLDPRAGAVQLEQELVADGRGIVDGDEAGEASALVGFDGAAGGKEPAVRGDVHAPRLDGQVSAPGEAAQDEHAGAIEIARVADGQPGGRAEAQQHDDGPGRLAAGEDDQLAGGVGALEVVQERRLVLEDGDAAGGQRDERSVAELRGGQRAGLAEDGVARDMVERRGVAGAGVGEWTERVDEDAGVVADQTADLEGGRRDRDRRGRRSDGDVGLGGGIVGDEGRPEPAGPLAAGEQRLAVAEDAGGEVRRADGRAQVEHGVERTRDVGDDRRGAGDSFALGGKPGIAGTGRGGTAFLVEEVAGGDVPRRRKRSQRRAQVVAAAAPLGRGVSRDTAERGVEEPVEPSERGHVAERDPRAGRRQRRHGARGEDGAEGRDGSGVGVDGDRGRQAAVAFAAVEDGVERGARTRRRGDGGAEGFDDVGAVHASHDSAAARRLIASEPGARAAAFADGCAPALAGGLGGRIAAALTAERAPWYLTILYGLLLFRRDHELEPLHEDVLARVLDPVAGLGPYDATLFAQDVGQLVDWGAVDRIIEAHKLRSYRDNRRERFRYRLTEDAVALLEWLEARLAAKLAGRAGDSRDRLQDVLGHLREVRRVLEDWRAGSRDPDAARRALYLIEAVGDAVDEVGTELLAFRGEMLAFASRPYDLDALRAILAWLERYVTLYVRRLEELRTDVAARLRELGAPRFQEALDECHVVVVEERAATPRALRTASVVPPGERITAQAAFFGNAGMLAALCGRIDESARAVVIKMQHHLREVERRSARLADLRAAIRLVAASPERDPRLGDLARAMVAAAHVRVDRRPASATQRLAPPMPRSHARTASPAAARPLARKRHSLEAARELAARRRAALGAWLESITDGGDRVRLSELALHFGEAPRRWLDVARVAHLGAGRALRESGFALQPLPGEAVLGDDTCGLAAPDCWIERRR